jgi:hypothetical protein
MKHSHWLSQRKLKKYRRHRTTTTTTTTESDPELADDLAEDGDGEKDMYSMLEHDEEAEEEKKKKLIEEEEQETKDEPSREIIRDNDIPLHGMSSAFNLAHFCNFWRFALLPLLCAVS